MKIAKLLLVALMLSQTAAFADSQERGAEITIFSGWSFLNARLEVDLCPFCLSPLPSPISETTVKQSVLLGFKGGYYINKQFEVEGGFAITPNHNVGFRYDSPVCILEQCPPIGYDMFYPFVSPPQNLVAYQYEGNFVYNLTGGDVRPFVTFGIGGISSDYLDSVRNNFAFNFGGGAKFYVKQVGIRLEINDHVIPSYFLNDKTEHDLQVQYGFIFQISKSKN